jgi:outer membrane protein insertion porin family
MAVKQLKWIFVAVSLILTNLVMYSQERAEIVDYSDSYDYIIGGVSVSGVRFLDTNALIGISGLRVGQEVSVPGDAVTNAVKKLWQQGLFSDVRISITKTVFDTVYLTYSAGKTQNIFGQICWFENTETQDLVEKINMPVDPGTLTS